MTGHEGEQGGGASPGDLKLLGVTLGAKEKVGGDKVENQELGAESLHRWLQIACINSCLQCVRTVAVVGLPNSF